MALKLAKCALCKEGPGYWVPVGRRQAPICASCLNHLSEFISYTATLRRLRRNGERRRRHLFRKALVGNVLKRGSVYASSLGWKFGLTRVEVYREVVKLAKKHRWKLTKTPSNHIIVLAGVGEDAEEHRATTTHPE